MKVLRLARSRVVLWAHQPGSDEALEVTRVIERPLQTRCTSAPRCPDQDSHAFTLDATVSSECPYAFGERGECVRHRNQRALEEALFLPGAAHRVARLLASLGYEVGTETVDTVHDARVLRAHSPIEPDQEVRVLPDPTTGGRIVLVGARPQLALARQASHSR
ncbi:MAG: hypothetical protein KDD82_22165 [Planctomycetes bacterium]|nr:hypothetical protein [Planctomycetota bacterium]